MASNDLCPKCGYDYCICNLNRKLEYDFNYPDTGAWPAPDWNLDPGHKVYSDEELKRIKDSFPKHRCPTCGRETE